MQPIRFAFFPGGAMVPWMASNIATIFFAIFLNALFKPRCPFPFGIAFCCSGASDSSLMRNIKSKGILDIRF